MSEATIEDIRAGWEKFAASFVARDAHEAVSDGKVETAGPGSVIFFPSHAVTQLRNPGKAPATYTVVYYFTPLTPKS